VTEVASALPAAYTDTFDRLLNDVATATADDVPLVPFWPLRGAEYAGELLVIGRSVNGWIEDWTARQLRDPATRGSVVEAMRADAELSGRDRMAWVKDLWGATDGYNTRLSAFWRVLVDLMGDRANPAKASQLVWTNLYKVSPAAGWNPGADLQRAQRARASDLLRIELEVYRPRRVLALTGDWIAPFAPELDLELTWQDGLVVATAIRSRIPWVIARHPMKKPHVPFVAEVRDAFRALGAPLP
jgi:hypothetical protein